MTPLNERLLILIIAICIVVCLLGPSIISLSERKNFNRLLDKLSFVAIPKSGPVAWAPQTLPRSQKIESSTLSTLARGSDFIRKYAQSFDLIFTSHYSWYHPFVEYFTGSIWTHAAVLYRPHANGELYVIEVTTVDSYNKRDNRNRRGLSIETFDTWLSFHDKETQLLMLQFSNSEIGYSRYCEQPFDFTNSPLGSPDLPSSSGLSGPLGPPEHTFANNKDAQLVLNNYHTYLSQRCAPIFLQFIDSLVNVRMNTGIDFIAPIWKRKFNPDKDNSIGPQANCSEFVAFFLQQFGFLKKRYRPRCYAPGDLVYTNDYSPYLTTTHFRVEL